MVGDNRAGREAMAAELQWLEGLLAKDEDWRALQQLEAREARGEGVTSIDGQGLKVALRVALAGNRFFKRRQMVLAEMAGAAEAAPKPHGTQPDDLSRIRGITPLMARRLQALEIVTFDQIAAWRAADVHEVSAILGLGRAISAENWIEQAALLQRSRPQSRPQTVVVAPVPVVVLSDFSLASVGSVLASPMAAAPAQPLAAEQTPAVERQEAAPDAATGVTPDDTVPAGPLAAWRYGHHQKSPMMIADALALLGMLHKTVLDESLAADRRIAAPDLDADIEDNGHCEHLAPALPFAAWRYSAPGASELPPPETPAGTGAQVVTEESVVLPPPPVAVPASQYYQAAAPAAEHRAEPAVAIAPAMAPVRSAAANPPPSPAPPVTPEGASWDEDTEREIRVIERLLATPAAAAKTEPRAAPEARVTIRRAEEAMSAAPRYQPPPRETSSRSPGKAAAIVGFDAAGYAAYRERIEEATVDIVRQPVRSGGAALSPAMADGTGAQSYWLLSLIERLRKAFVGT